MFDIRLLLTRMAALPVGIAICLCSCALTCNYLLLGVSMPSFYGRWWIDLETIMYLAKLGGGMAVTAAQIFGLIVYRLGGDPWMRRVYWGATAVSVFISICTFHSMIATGAINAKHHTKEFIAMEAERDRLITALAEMRDEKRRIVQGLTAVNKITKASEKGADYEGRIAVYEGRLRRTNDRIAAYSKRAGSDDVVSAAGTYKTIADDIQKFWNMPNWVNPRIVIILTYFMLIAVAMLIDLTGTRLISFSIGGRPPVYVMDEPEYRYVAPPTAPTNGGRKKDLNDDEQWDAPQYEDAEPHDTYFAPDDVEQKIVDAYHREKSYNGIFRHTGIGKNAETLSMVKRVLDKFGVCHGPDNDSSSRLFHQKANAVE
jgi:hypothetical protein